MKNAMKTITFIAFMAVTVFVNPVWAAPKEPLQILKSLYAKHLNPVLAEQPDSGSHIDQFSPIYAAMNEVREELIRLVAQDIEKINFRQTAQRERRVMQWVRAIFESKSRLMWKQNYWLLDGNLGADFLARYSRVLAPLKQTYAEDMHEALHDLFDVLRKENYTIGQTLVITRMFAVLRPPLDHAGYPGTEDPLIGWAQYHFPNIGDWLTHILLKTRDQNEVREFISYSLWTEVTFPGILKREGLTERLFLQKAVQKHLKEIGVKPGTYMSEFCRGRLSSLPRP